MSVLVKGMKMPDSCRHCCMTTGTFCDVLNIDVDPYYDGAKHRNVSCPLVELPEKHGRLIDADSLADDLEYDAQHFDDDHELKFNAAMWLRSNKNKVIVEAEGK